MKQPVIFACTIAVSLLLYVSCQGEETLYFTNNSSKTVTYTCDAGQFTLGLSETRGHTVPEQFGIGKIVFSVPGQRSVVLKHPDRTSYEFIDAAPIQLIVYNTFAQEAILSSEDLDVSPLHVPANTVKTGDYVYTERPRFVVSGPAVPAVVELNFVNNKVYANIK
jgi:hypothetical protein